MLITTVFALVNHGVAAAIGVAFVQASAIVHIANPRPHCLGVYTGVQIADIFIPEVYGTIVPNDRVDTLAFVQSGVVVTNPLLQEKAQSGARLIEVPMWNDLNEAVEPNLSDDTDTDATVGDVTSDSWNARNAFLNKGFGAADLAVELSGTTPGQGEPMTRIRNRFGAYWNYHFQKRVISICNGILAKNVAANGGDMRYSIATEDGNAATDANRISADAVTEAVFTMGDRFQSLRAIAMHSFVYKKLVKQQMIEFVKDADGTLLYQSYLGLRVIVDDGLPVVAGATSGFKYTTVLFGAGAIGFGEGSPKVPFEIDRLPSKGSGGGLENIWERKTWLIHPEGHDWLNAVVAGASATNAELANANNWARKLVRKKVPMAFLITNG